jgi:hypothetical protein
LQDIFEFYGLVIKPSSIFKIDLFGECILFFDQILIFVGFDQPEQLIGSS